MLSPFSFSLSCIFNKCSDNYSLSLNMSNFLIIVLFCFAFYE